MSADSRLLPLRMVCSVTHGLVAVRISHQTVLYLSPVASRFFMKMLTPFFAFERSGFGGWPLALTLSAGLLVGCKKDKENPAPVPVVMTDIDGNVYPTITIGGVVWTSENLRTTRYKDGAPIPTGLDIPTWISTTNGAYSIYGDLPVNNTTYGKLYNWAAVNTGRLAPAGWHVPSQTEWTALANSLGGLGAAGGKLKSTSSLWIAPNIGADNSSGFGGLPGGYRGTTGGYATLGNTGFWWSSTERNSTQANYTSLDNGTASALSNGATKTFGYSVRCVRD